MSKDIIVLAPNGRRQTIHCTADTSILQILEDVCLKHGFQASEYDLKHHNHLLDLTTTIRFSNLPNRATVEMVEAERKREENNVTVGLLLEDGERRTADFPPTTSLFDLITSLAASELSDLQNPCILYMRQEVTGIDALRDKTLRKLGLIKGRAILRLLNKAEEGKQANVSTVYRVPLSENLNKTDKPQNMDVDTAGPSHKTIDPISFIRSVKKPCEVDYNTEEDNEVEKQKEVDNKQKTQVQNEYAAPKNTLIDKKKPHVNDKLKGNSSNSYLTQESLMRRLNIEKEVTFLGDNKAIAFLQPDMIQAEIEDLPDDFYDLSIDEVRNLYHDLQQNRIVLENTPLITARQREELEAQTSKQKLAVYKNAVVRIQFPDRIILQGVFLPTNTIQDIVNFVKEYLRQPNKKFYIYSTPLKETLDPNTTLLDARYVPCVHLHFKWLEDDSNPTYLKEAIYTKTTSSDAASILASKYRAPSRRKMDDEDTSKNAPSTSKTSKLPKWFKN